MTFIRHQLIFLIFGIFSQDAAIMKEMSIRYQSVRSECIISTGVDEIKVKSLEKAEQIYDDDLYCYAGCIMNQLNMVRFAFFLNFRNDRKLWRLFWTDWRKRPFDERTNTRPTSRALQRKIKCEGEIHYRRNS